MAGKYLIFAIVIPTVAVAITVSSNGNSPQRKMLGGMIVDLQKGFAPMKPTRALESTYDRSRKRYNTTGLAINERYRRLIPYMTFYYANDLVNPSKESYSTPNVEVQKVNIQEKAMSIRAENKVGNSQLRDVPVYRGNRLTQYNIASANPSKLIQYARPPPYQPSPKLKPKENIAYVNPSTSSTKPTYNPNLFYYQTIPEHTRKPSTVIYQATENPIQFYPDGQKQDQFKLVPYDQTPPIQMQEQIPNYQVYSEQLRPPSHAATADENPTQTHQKYVQPPHQYKSVHVFKEPEVITSDNYNVPNEGKYENVQNKPVTKLYKPENFVQHSIETDFIPIFNPNIAPPEHRLQKIQISPEKPLSTIKVISPTTPIPEYSIESDSISYDYQRENNYPNIEVAEEDNNITRILETLQNGKKPTKENLTASIRTLLNILNSLKSTDQQYYELNTVEPVLSTPTPFADHTPRPVIIENVNEKIPVLVNGLVSAIKKPILRPVIHQHPSQYLDADYSAHPQPVRDDDDYSEEDTPEGGTPGIPGVDYPLFTSIPETSFDCKTQRYKGFFGDPETHCQVWHYCDLNGGQASFLCPNGTIFSQVALTCDWWFNVKCSTTTQLYVLNERLYKYILPFTPKFPEDYSGPLVDKYLTIKFKEMEEKFKKNKKKNPTPTMESVELKDENTPVVEVVTSSKNGELTPYNEEAPQ